jgi:hypothetical protein
MQSNRHYIPLEKDFGNFHQVLFQMRNQKGKEVVEQAHKDLIESGRYSFQRFIEQFDQELITSRFNPTVGKEEVRLLDRLLYQRQDGLKQKLERLLYAPYYNKWLGKRFVMPIAQPAGRIYFKLKGYKKGF